jgi:hypothetical protein
MSINERVLFWVNIYNTITGTQLLARFPFLQYCLLRALHSST